MRILITGGKGMLGRTLCSCLAPEHRLFIADLPDVDILESAALADAFETFAPEAVIHCAAMTNVDKCESAPDAAFRLNAEASRLVAEACRKYNSRLIAISTDYVFAGDKTCGGYSESDVCEPRTVYGASKLLGERQILSVLPQAQILRIAWLYGSGGPSFVHTMANLGTREGAALKVVNDQRGNPTSAAFVARVIRHLLAHPELEGVIHGSCGGVCSWYDFACEIFRLLGLSRCIEPCTTAEFPRPAPRPANSALEKKRLEESGFAVASWQEELRAFVAAEVGRLKSE